MELGRNASKVEVKQTFPLSSTQEAFGGLLDKIQKVGNTILKLLTPGQLIVGLSVSPYLTCDFANSLNFF